GGGARVGSGAGSGFIHITAANSADSNTVDASGAGGGCHTGLTGGGGGDGGSGGSVLLTASTVNLATSAGVNVDGGPGRGGGGGANGGAGSQGRFPIDA